MNIKLFLTASLSLGLISSCNFANNTDTSTKNTANNLVLRETNYVEKKGSYGEEKNPSVKKPILSGKTIDEVEVFPAPSYNYAQIQAPELSLPKEKAFAIDTEISVKSVQSIDTKAFNQTLMEAHQNQAKWSRSLLQISLQFLEFIGEPLSEPGQNIPVLIPSENDADQNISISIPGEWEPGSSFQLARVTVERGGWLDDATAGERYVLWIVLSEEGGLQVQRVLQARLCSRPNKTFYSAGPCP